MVSSTSPTLFTTMGTETSLWARELLGLLEHRGMAPQEHHQPRVLVGDPWDLDAPVSLAKTEQLS
jgi:hypothetical protein